MNPEVVANYFNEWGIFAFIFSIGISIIVAILSVIPSYFVTVANILAFGPINGFFISLIGETVGAYFAFFLYRTRLFKNSKVLDKKHPIIHKLVQSKGVSAGMLVFKGRLLPFIPSGFVTIAASVSQISSLSFIFWTSLGKIPSLLLESMAAIGIVHIKSTNTIMLLTFLIVILIQISYHLIKNK